jgi:hypothetical protein
MLLLLLGFLFLLTNLKPLALLSPLPCALFSAFSLFLFEYPFLNHYYFPLRLAIHMEVEEEGEGEHQLNILIKMQYSITLKACIF